ncbi:hypothetical protein BDI4_300059 [Burkholderia diffusa]|nr:hypothetical protein BDI4_300059 [Burkholderia diffusa]
MKIQRSPPTNQPTTSLRDFLPTQRRIQISPLLPSTNPEQWPGAGALPKELFFQHLAVPSRQRYIVFVFAPDTFQRRRLPRPAQQGEEADDPPPDDMDSSPASQWGLILELWDGNRERSCELQVRQWGKFSRSTKFTP